MPAYLFDVPPECNRFRLDVFVTQAAALRRLGLSRTAIQDLLVRGLVTVNGQRGLKSNSKVVSGDSVSVDVPEAVDASVSPERIPLDVVYDDSDVAVIDKKSGIVVHPAPGNTEHTLVNALLFRFKRLSNINPRRPGIVHRLDKDTSGLLVVAKNNDAHLSLAAQFAEHSIKRKYVALVKGEMEFDENVIELPLARHPLKRKSMAVSYSQESKYARTAYRTIKRTPTFSLVELEPFTGRTHQLRVHLAFIGHPILGDPKYGAGNDFSRLALHAKYLGFMHPKTKKFVDFSSPIPKEFKQFLIENKT